MAEEIMKYDLYVFCLNYDHFEGNVGILKDFEGDVCQRRLQREFDKTTYQYRQQYIAKFGNDFQHPKFKWQKSFHDHIIRNEKDFNNHWNYTMYNYLKHNLPENWKYTGLNYPELIDDINDFEIE